MARYIDGDALRERVNQSTYVIGVHHANEANGKPMVLPDEFIQRSRVFALIDWMLENEAKDVQKREFPWEEAQA